MDERLPLRIRKRLVEQLALPLEALLEGQGEGVLDRIHATERRMLAALALLDLRALLVERGRVAIRFDFIGAVAGLWRQGMTSLGFRERNRGGHMIAVRQFVDEAGHPSGLRRDRFARCDEVYRGLRTG